MGTGIRIYCRNCNYGGSFQLGVGMAFSSLETILQFLHPKKRLEISTILKNYPVYDEEYQYEIFRCPRCNRFFDRLRVSFKYDEDKTYVTKFKCTKCRKELLRIEVIEMVQNYPCPTCMSNSLTFTQELLWD